MTTRRSAARRRGALLAAATLAITMVAGCTDPGATDSDPTDSKPTRSTAAAKPSGPSTTTTTSRPDTDPSTPAGFVATGPISAPNPIGPAPGSELEGIDRDAGVSVRLRDGSTLWLFGDTAEADANGSLTYFVIGTAAWSRPGSPTITNDFAVGARPVVFARPTPEFPPCPGNAPTPGVWPSSAVVQHVGDLDRVIVWMENICLGSSIRGAARGMSVADWFYDPAAPPTEQPIQARILNQTLFPQRSFGLASVVDEDGDAIVYSCVSPEQGGMPEQYGPCRAAKVDLDDVANPMAYRVWNGRDYVADPFAAAPMAISPGVVAAPFPAGSFSVTHDPHLDQFVMVYSPWPGYSDSLLIRTAATPTGPWSEPAVVALPGCSDPVGTVTFWCYAASAQPIFSEPGKLGVGYYDRRVTSGPVRGSYLVATVPYEVPAG